MKSKYASAGLNYDLINEKFKDIDEYEDTANFFLADENFKLLGSYLEDEDYAMAKDAVKGLYILAGELRMYPLYEALLEVYEDLEEELYRDVTGHYDEMMTVYEKVRGIFCA